MNLDPTMLLLNAASGAALVKTFFNEDMSLKMEMNLTTIGGFLVLISIVVLNVAKAYKEIKTAKNNNQDNQDKQDKEINE